ncbi:MAG: acyl-CoA dehydrogenase family protein [Chloroflexota bacterium]|nr:acyl-CoA dehydrogenase family protein [Chloroflexota bacterium]
MPDSLPTGVKRAPLRVGDPAFEGIVERIAAASDAIEEQRRIPVDIAADMIDEGLFRLLVPRSLGSGEVDYLDYLAMVRAISAADGSTGWCFNQNNILGTMASLMPRPLAEEVWSDPRSVLCNGPPQFAQVTEVAGGYSLTGRWNFSSGSPQATWAVAINRVADATSMTFIIPKEQVTFYDSWLVNGLRGTGSFSFETKDLFVPASRAYNESKTPLEPGPLYLMPRSLFFGSGFGNVALGVARSALDLAREVAMRKTPQEQIALRDQPAVQADIGRAEALWGGAAAFLDRKASELWRSAVENGAISMDERMGLRLASTHAIRQSADVVDIAYGVFGANAIFETSPIQRKFQDAHAITQQIQGRPEFYQIAGQHILGLEPRGRFF